jgi:DNA (cytosine-5)-methyltransferase 1
MAIVLPSIEDGERLQGFPSGWTSAAATGRRDQRWKLIGNAVTVGVAEWIGRRLSMPGSHDELPNRRFNRTRSWPRAAWGGAGQAFASSRSEWPETQMAVDLAKFINHGTTRPLSLRASTGFYSRVKLSGFSVDESFASAMEAHIEHQRAAIGMREDGNLPTAAKVGS